MDLVIFQDRLRKTDRVPRVERYGSEEEEEDGLSGTNRGTGGLEPPWDQRLSGREACLTCVLDLYLNVPWGYVFISNRVSRPGGFEGKMGLPPLNREPTSHLGEHSRSGIRAPYVSSLGQDGPLDSPACSLLPGECPRFLL